MDNITKNKIDQQRRYVLSVLNEMGFTLEWKKGVYLDVSLSVDQWIEKFQEQKFEDGESHYDYYLFNLPYELNSVFISTLNELIQDIEIVKNGKKSF